MLQFAQSFLAGYYLQIKFIHLVFAGMWFWSTSVAYTYYLVPLFRDWLKNPEDPDRIRLRNWAMERFDEGAILEHVAFPILLITGPMLMIAGGWTLVSSWLAMKLVLVVLVFIPVEVMDYYLAHFSLNKAKIRATGTPEAYEKTIRLHWWFLVVSTPIVIVVITLIFYLAIVKPF